MKQQFSEWYSSIVYKNFSDEIPPPVDLQMSIMKSLEPSGLRMRLAT